MKMSDNFYLPVSVFAEHSGPENLPSHMLFNSRKFAFYTGEYHMNAAAHAINRHDKLVEALQAAMNYIDESPCDPDIYPEQLEAWNKLKSLNVKELINDK